MWKSAWNIASENFLTGVGIGNYSLAIKPSAPYREPIYAHNLYLDIAAETGFVTMSIWLSLLLATGIAYLKKTKGDIFWSGGLIGLVIFSAHSLFETALFSVHVLPLLIIFISLSNPDE
jgi:O-antigen ligase